MDSQALQSFFFLKNNKRGQVEGNHLTVVAFVNKLTKKFSITIYWWQTLILLTFHGEKTNPSINNERRPCWAQLPSSALGSGTARAARATLPALRGDAANSMKHSTKPNCLYYMKIISCSVVTARALQSPIHVHTTVFYDLWDKDKSPSVEVLLH